jgi:hypothetical protein
MEYDQLTKEVDVDAALAGVERRSGWKRGVGVAAAALGLAVVGTFTAKGLVQTSNLGAMQSKEERLDIVPSFAACSKSGENCWDTGCCSVSGHGCYSKKFGVAQCNETCTPGKAGFTCAVVGEHSVPASMPLDTSLYCFAVFTQNTGSPKKNTELDLLNAQMKAGVSLFACDFWDVFSDDIGTIDNTYGLIKVEDTFGEFHRVKRKVKGTWVNWGLFYQVWIKLREVGNFRKADYVVKVDADAVFVPQRLRDWLSFGSRGYDSPHGVYYENCPNVQYGFFGNLEVMTKTAASVLTTYLEECHEVFAPCADDGCDWKFGSWGEDVFIQRCMDHHYIDKVEAFDVTTDGMCPAHRPAGEKKNKKWHATDCSKVTTPAAHPFKKPKEYMKCMSEMTGQQYNV